MQRFLFFGKKNDEATLRARVRALYDSGVREICVDGRKHADFCKDKWWQDLGAVLEEAERLSMKVWISDDSRFPSGYAAGALSNAPTQLYRQNLFFRELNYDGDGRVVTFRTYRWVHPPKQRKMTPEQKECIRRTTADAREHEDDEVYGVSVYGPKGEMLDVTDRITWSKPAGSWRAVVTGFTRNIGPYRDNINLLDQASCRLFIDAVYEKHYAHFASYFGTVIAGFFTDEPELGGTIPGVAEYALGAQPYLPWSEELAASLQEKYGENLRRDLPLLWKNDGDKETTQRMREIYTDCVQTLLEKNFYGQMRSWCEEHEVAFAPQSLVAGDGFLHKRGRIEDCISAAARKF